MQELSYEEEICKKLGITEEEYVRRTEATEDFNAFILVHEVGPRFYAPHGERMEQRVKGWNEAHKLFLHFLCTLYEGTINELINAQNDVFEMGNNGLYPGADALLLHFKAYRDMRDWQEQVAQAEKHVAMLHHAMDETQG